MALSRSPITITPLTPALIPPCARLAALAPDPWQAAHLTAALQDATRHVFVAMDGGEPLGFACFLRVDSTADLELVVVDPAHRKKGAACLLLADGLEKMAALGCTQCLLEVRCQNQAAIHLYKKLGFKTLALRKGLFSHPAEDGYLMALSLATLPGANLL